MDSILRSLQDEREKYETRIEEMRSLLKKGEEVNSSLLEKLGKAKKVVEALRTQVSDERARAEEATKELDQLRQEELPTYLKAIKKAKATVEKQEMAMHSARARSEAALSQARVALRATRKSHEAEQQAVRQLLSRVTGAIGDFGEVASRIRGAEGSSGAGGATSADSGAGDRAERERDDFFDF